jgi:hypothetical protein
MYWIVREKNGEVYKVNSQEEVNETTRNIGGCFTILDHKPTKEDINRIVTEYYM